MTRALVAIGSNRGWRGYFFRATLSRLRRFLPRLSPIFQTAPMGPFQRNFLNAAALLRVPTSLSPWQMLRTLRATECALGRFHKSHHWGPRRLDLDLIFMGNKRRRACHKLRLPHPGWAQRGFVLRPAAFLMPNAVPPGARQPLRFMAATNGQGAKTTPHPRPPQPSRGLREAKKTQFADTPASRRAGQTRAGPSSGR